MLTVETDKAIYEILFGQFQIDITNYCNLNCDHCRVLPKNDVYSQIQVIDSIAEFAMKHGTESTLCVLSGGEPLLHPEFRQILSIIKSKGCRNIAITTNGYYLDANIIKYIDSVGFSNIVISVSVDSLHSSEHDKYRGLSDSYEAALLALRRSKNANFSFKTSIRATLRPNQIVMMEEMVKLAIAEKCNTIIFSTIFPSGNAKYNKTLCMDKIEFRGFMDSVYYLSELYKDIIVVNTNDPLKCLYSKNNPAINSGKYITTCPAGTASFAMRPNGVIVPCPMLDVELFDINNLKIEEIEYLYCNNEFITNMLDRNLKGKCMQCPMKYSCGGCRARALDFYGDHLQHDPYCWH